MDNLIKLAYPFSPYCFICGAAIPLENEYQLCSSCMEKLRFDQYVIDKEALFREFKIDAKSSLKTAISCSYYGMYEKKLIGNLKFSGKTYYARTIAKIMADRVLSDEEVVGNYIDIDYIVPVPLNEGKLNKRGFNQCGLIANFFRIEMPDIFEFTVENDLLIRNVDTKPMKDITGYERYINLENVFSVNPVKKKKLQGKKILLIDDVYTSGSTAEHCAAVLLGAGAKEVHFYSYSYVFRKQSEDYNVEMRI